jgi:hypothetical protein
LGQSDVYLVKFPPQLKVEEVIGYTRFGIKKKGIWVKVQAWNDDLEHVEVLRDTWIKVTGLETKWCEWNSLDQVISVCGLLLDVDCLSVFRNNALEVIVKVNCKDPSKIPAGRLFGYHGNLFHIGFTLESVVPTGDDSDDLLGEELEDQGKKDAEGGPSNQGGQDNGGLNGPPPRSQSFSLGNVSQALASDQFIQKDQAVNLPPDDRCSPGSAKASVVFQLLVQKGLVDSESAFVWDKTPSSAAVNEEVKRFWYSEKILKNNINQMIKEASEHDFDLPDKIMPYIEIPTKILVQETNVPAMKESKWGPVQPIRKSSRIDRSKNILEKAQ